MNITGTQVAYYHTCKRKLWLFVRDIAMESNSDLVAEGRLIGETAYADRAQRYQQIELPGIKIDYYDPREGVVHEVKKSNKLEPSHIAQVKFYLYCLEQHGIHANYGILEYPTLRQTSIVRLEEADRQAIALWVAEIEKITADEHCPPVIRKPRCKTCAYFDFCYVEEED